jgi:hypothetical protein
MKKFLLATAALALFAASASAQMFSDGSAKIMSGSFAGEWCYGSGYDPQTKSTNFKLPSWTEGECDKSKILEIDGTGFYFNHTGYSCSVVSAKYFRDVAPASGKTAYLSNVVAKCQKEGSAAKTMTFEFYRYKGNLEVK